MSNLFHTPLGPTFYVDNNSQTIGFIHIQRICFNSKKVIRKICQLSKPKIVLLLISSIRYKDCNVCKVKSSD